MVSLIKPAHGYAIMQHVERITDGGVVIGPGTMYGTLKKLLKRRLIRRFEPGSENERKITYSLTDEGRRILEVEIARLNRLVGIGDCVILELRKEGRE